MYTLRYIIAFYELMHFKTTKNNVLCFEVFICFGWGFNSLAVIINNHEGEKKLIIHIEDKTLFSARLNQLSLGKIPKNKNILLERR